MALVIKQIDKEDLPRYAAISESFIVESIITIEVSNNGLGGFLFKEHKVQPYHKWHEPYNEEDSPINWSNKFDVDQWGIFLALERDIPMGGIAIGADAPDGLTSPFESKNNAVVWDIRVVQKMRKTGLGTILFRNGVEWARANGYARLKLETTSANLPMFHFCVKQGCELVAIHKYGYEIAEPHEAMLIWYYKL